MYKKFSFIVKLMLVTILSCLVLVFLEYRQKKQLKDPYLGMPVFPNLSIQNIDRISLTNNKKNKLILSKGQNSWVIQNRWNFPVNPGSVEHFLQSCENTKILRKIFINNQQYYDYFTQNTPSQIGGDSGICIELFTQNHKQASFCIGQPIWDEKQEFIQARYLAKNMTKNSLFIVQESFEQCSTNPLAWINPNFCKGFSSIRSLSLEVNNRLVWKLERLENKIWQITPKPLEGKILNLGNLKKYSLALEGAFFSDIVDPCLSSQETGLNQAYTLTLKDTIGNYLIYKIGKQNQQYGFYGKMIYRPKDPSNNNQLENWIFIFDPAVIKGILVPYSDFIK